MKLKWFFWMIVGFVVLAFAWLTYSLVYFSNNEFLLKNQLLKSGRQVCVLKIIEVAKQGDFESNNVKAIYLKNIKVLADSSIINQYLLNAYKGSYEANYKSIGKVLFANIDVSKAKKVTLKKELDDQVKLYLLEVFLLTVLVGGGIFGVYYSVNSMYDLNKQQNNFLLSVTHEFKTPIATMKLMLQTIRMRDLPREKTNELLDKAIQNSNRLNELTENMLTAMQIENEEYTFGEEELNISELVLEVADNLRIKGEINVEVEKDVMLFADPFILKICVNNLVENALKYSNFNPVSILVRKTSDKAFLTVSDSGIGIPESERKKVFKRFYRVEDEETRETKGTGLGLFIVKQSIEKQGGTVIIKSNKPKGTSFVIELPLKK